MFKEEQIRVIKGLINHLDNGTNVDAGGQVRNPVSSYTDETIAADEWQEFFLGHGQLLGLSGDLPEPGSFLTNNDLGKPILCTRDQAGKFHAFLNVCTHRGTIVESAPRGKKKVFSCPFHAWSFSHEGDLVSVPREEQFGPVDKSCHGLTALPAEEKYGMLFVHPSPDGTLDVDDLLGELAPELANWNLEQFIAQGDTTYTHAMNWKLAIDTFGETYHFNTLHKNSLAESFYGNCQMYDTYQRNHRMALCMRNIDTLRDQPESEWNVLQAALPVYYLFPNIQLILSGAGPTLVRVYPNKTDPNNSLSQINFYLHPMIKDMEKNAENQEMFEQIENRMQGFADVIDKEDYAAAALGHKGAHSGAIEYFTFGRNEPALHHYHNTYRDALGLPPLERISN
ncbi:aromatic ring-hydroxylating dioxygenase subunit alpha [Pseudomonadales bacterium]|jgi:phenylpropionate dioxygenase-like ring-hydroxylating dioxygenase large terminal subunit|nr:aromatic ring-hydroxylating dioxygenase subunit alpha [Gammaproteobacteria bacterium]MDA7755496.1 aromatic ring-hydroxylating dioxygenase subunit alpha [Pseudomonadales bacterium]MDA7774896.1 aromatic ring-hydroxylating dioxygenase subunit alpha [Pseudomonadales bacterium]MDC1084238.1 aromatic ring-hydroxylating dioxygenase subunit alpha [Pseudomonadales bacterium]MDC6450648.1 aromatic ring-hydroxylating dioxygenase subunit alpha [Pseudomonadales bacterium]|tara:strand:- start:5056 stop:6246 length:1191 start_codon:yes stop_codon:yes gene_type:complete